MGTVRTGMKYGAILIGVYLLVSHATGAGNLIKQGGLTGVAGVKAFQGR